MIRCAVGGYTRYRDHSGSGKRHQKGCRAASARTGARTRRGGMRWRVRGAAHAVAQRDVHRGLCLRWRKACTGGRLALRCRSLSTMAARHICALGMPNRDWRTATQRMPTPPMPTTRMRTNMPTHIICRTRNTPRVLYTVPLGSLHRNSVLRIHRLVL